MKLFNRFFLSYIPFIFIAFLIGGIVLSFMIRSIFYSQIDQNLLTEKLLIEEQINYSENLPDFRLVFGHLVEVTVFNAQCIPGQEIKDTLLFDRQKSELVPYRQLIVKGTSVNKRGYLIRMYLPLDSTETLIKAIIIAFSLLFLILISFLISGNYLISKSVWRPFYKTLDKLNQFDLSLSTSLDLGTTNISEFRQLNSTLDKMSKKLQRDYRNLKEFNENASHEIQTPLAIIKSKLELLMQDESLTKSQIKIIKAVFESAARMSKLNSGLLLISKIDNNQFPTVEKVDFQSLVEKYLEQLTELISEKRITVSLSFSAPSGIEMNPALAEILISNLFSNAIQHNSEGGTIDITMTGKKFWISNSGCAISFPPEKLFERFRKSGHHSDSIGLGLAIVKKIISFYNFSIDYQVNGLTHQVTILFTPGN